MSMPFMLIRMVPRWGLWALLASATAALFCLLPKVEKMPLMISVPEVIVEEIRQRCSSACQYPMSSRAAPITRPVSSVGYVAADALVKQSPVGSEAAP